MIATNFEPAHLLKAAIDCERSHNTITCGNMCVPDLMRGAYSEIAFRKGELRDAYSEIAVLKAELWKSGMGTPRPERADVPHPPVAEAVCGYDEREAQGRE